MRLNEALLGRRRPRSVCIVTELPVRLQQENAATQEPDTRPLIVPLASAKIRISETATGEIVIEIEPP
jgi:hypothetical protein